MKTPRPFTTISLVSVIVMGLIIGLLVAAWLTPANSSTVPRHYRWHHPCSAEDGPGPCFWNADHRGNDRGTSYHLNQREQQFVPTKDTDGHDGCWIHVAERSVIRCDDGYRTTKS